MGVLADKSYSRNTASYPEQAVFPSPWEGIGLRLQKTVVLHPRGTGPPRLQILAVFRPQMPDVLRLRITAGLRLQMLAPLRPKEF